ncbi:MAG: pyridoxamine 5'-phosphate oxidase family protein [Elusimicrobiota bacterium]|jgi:uncharacterized pyridoxamine 5'-phosphate oxidase family protein|nr:pyridoxamine 5'-phosphate oxidase family protein [Elusimicrobiota bacterium]
MIDKIKEIVDFLQKSKIFYFATCDDGQARVRPFGAVFEFNGKLYFVTGSQKDVYKQLEKNPKFEVSSTLPDGQTWIRLTAKAVLENDVAAKQKAFEIFPFLANMYKSPDSQTFAVFSAKDIKANIFSMGAGKREIL